MKKITVKLKQHTPMIHFQNYKKGSMTIRGTDVKPRLDMYLWSNSEVIDLKKYKLQEEHSALDYSIRIVSLQPMQSQKIEGGRDRTWLPFFANMGDDYLENEKYLVFPENFNVEAMAIHIKSQHDEIINLIAKKISSFFNSTNFMTRSSKGFGSFTVSDIDGRSVQELPKANYFTSRLSNDFKDQSRLFSEIDLFYKAIRGGINVKNRNGETEFYFKSCLFKYLYSKGIQWDKKTIKSRFMANAQTKECEKYQDEIVCNPNGNYIDQQAWKLFLGLASNESWLSQRTTLTAELNIGKEKFTRSPSFLLLKPIFFNNAYRVYLIEDYSKLELYPKEVTVNFEWKDQILSLGIGDIVIMKGFLPWVFNNIDGRHGEPQSFNKASTLTRIFSELQSNSQNAQ